MVALKGAEYRRREDGKRVVTIDVRTDDLSTLPTSAEDIEGLSPDDIIDEGSIAQDVNTGDVAMYGFDGQWHIW